jgi:hypothetical protein
LFDRFVGKVFQIHYFLPIYGRRSRVDAGSMESGRILVTVESVIEFAIESTVELFETSGSNSLVAAGSRYLRCLHIDIVDPSFR